MDNSAPWRGAARRVDDVKVLPDTAGFTRTVAIAPEGTCGKPLLQVFRDNNGDFDFESWRANSPPLAAFHCKAHVSEPYRLGAI